MSIGDNSILRVVVEQTHPVGSLILNVHYWNTEFGASEDEATVISDLVTHLDSMYGEIDALQKTTYAYDLYRFYEWTGSAWNLIGTGDPTLTVAATGNSMPSGCAMVVRAYTNVSRTLGRKFLAGFTEDNYSGEDWDTTLQTAAAAYLAKWYDTYDAGSSRVYIPGVIDAFKSFYAFNEEGVVNAIPGYQRRRKEGVGA